jgi:transcriptional repressor NrdR
LRQIGAFLPDPAAARYTFAVQCPYCGGDSQVVDSRSSTEGVRRRRTCNECRRRFTTYEKAGSPIVKVIKRDGATEPFAPDKIAKVLRRVGRDRPALSEATANRLARGIEAQLLDERVKQIRSTELVDRLLSLLRAVDQVAHDRLAANYLDETGILRTERSERDADAGQLGLFGDDDD